jgi:hypothetical protein
LRTVAEAMRQAMPYPLRGQSVSVPELL